MSQYQCYMKYTYGFAHLSDDLVKSELLKQLPIKQRICNKCRKIVYDHLSKKKHTVENNQAMQGGSL